MISVTDAPPLFAAEVLAERTEWGRYTVVSIPAEFIVDLTQRVSESFEAPV